MANPLPDDWSHWLGQEFQAEYMSALKAFLADEKAAKKVIYPHSSNWFRAFELTPLASVKVVILGQDPYHGPNQAHGLCFSVQPGVPVPPSLVNIYKELASDVGFTPVQHGFLEAWAKQGGIAIEHGADGRAGQCRVASW
jgi:uracil-DNA glycosylase